MANYLSEQWLAAWGRALGALPERPGADARVRRVVTGGPDGDVTYHLVLVDGRVTTTGLGPGEEPDITFTSPYDVGLAIATGDLDPSVAFMQGRLKVDGEPGPLHTVLPLASGDGWRRAVEAARPD
jgi:hypothetical protein